MRYEKSYRKSGFTLIESMLGLIVFSMIVSFALMATRISKKEMAKNYDDQVQAIVQDLESAKHGFKLIKVESDRLTLYSVVEEKTYYLSMYENHNMLRYTPGHMPLMLNVQRVWFRKESNLIRIEIMVNGKKIIEHVFIPEK